MAALEQALARFAFAETLGHIHLTCDEAIAVRAEVERLQRQLEEAQATAHRRLDLAYAIKDDLLDALNVAAQLRQALQQIADRARLYGLDGEGGFGDIARDALAGSVPSTETGGECGCDYELVEDGSVQRKRWFHEPGCPAAGSTPDGTR